MAAFSGEIKIDGESFVPDGIFKALSDSFISITSVLGFGGPSPPTTDIPAPASGLLLLIGLLGLCARKIKLA